MKRSTRRIENFKSFDREMALMDLVESFAATSVKIARDPNISARLTKNGKKMELELDDCSLKYGDANDEQHKRAAIILNDRKYFISSNDLQSSETSIETRKRTSYDETLSIYAFEIAGFRDNKVSRFRSFFQVDPEKMRKLEGEFETVTYQNDGREYLFDCVRFEVEAKSFDITQFKTTEKAFYVIESLNNLDIEIFRDYCFAIQQSLGFISGYMPGGEQYIFSSTLEMHYINHLRPAIKSMYIPICTNPYSRLYDQIELADKYVEKLTRIPPAVLSNLVHAIKNDEKLSSSILLLLESSSIHSILLIPSVFSVIIEALSKIISVPELGVEDPIEDPSLKDKIIDELTGVIDEHADALTEKSIIKLKNRLREINRPINRERLTNNEKLTQPFYQLQIALSAEDIAAIEHRNDLLHGNILMENEEKVKTLEETNTYMLYISGKLYTLVSKLLLKYVKYDGLVYNHSKHYEKYVGIETKEEYFEKILASII